MDSLVAMPHFFLAPGAIHGDAVTITGSLAGHVGGALRHRAGDRITVVDEHRHRYRILVTEADSHRVLGHIVERLPDERLHGLRVTLAQSLLKGAHMDLVLQKATELGARRLAPLVTRRTVVRPREHRASRQAERWRTIVLEAAQQAEQPEIPTVDDPRPFAEWLRSDPALHGTRLVLWERERSRTLREQLARSEPDAPATLLVGPEGGFDPEEIEAAGAAGFVPVSLGRAILRAETAGVAALTILQYVWGSLGGPQATPGRAPSA